MDYPDRVYNYLVHELEPGCEVNIAKLKEPNRFLCAVNYLVSCGYITNLEFGINDNYKKLKKYNPR